METKKKETYYDQTRIDRLTLLMNSLKTEKGRPLKQSDLSRITGVSRKHISNILTDNKPLTEATAKKIISGLNKAYPLSRFRYEWLLGYDDFQTINEIERKRDERELSEIFAFLSDVDKSRTTFASIEKTLASLGYKNEIVFSDKTKHLSETGHLFFMTPQDEPYYQTNGLTFTQDEMSRLYMKIIELIDLEVKWFLADKQRSLKKAAK